MAFDILDIRMRLSGARQVQASADESAAAMSEVGVAAERAGAQASAGAAGVAEFSAASKVGAATAATSAKTMATSMKATGANMTRAFTVPFLLIGAVGAKMAVDFEQQMTLVQTQAGASAQEVANMRQPILDLAKVSEQGPEELAKGLYRVESAGFRGQKALDVLKVASEGAAVGNTDVESTAHALGAAVNSNIRGAHDFTHAMGVLNAAVGEGDMRMADLTGALSTGLLPRAKAVGLRLQDVTTALDTMTRSGMPAQASATRLGMTMSFLAAPTDTAKEALKGIGLSQFDLAKTMRGKEGLVGALTLLKQHLRDLPKEQQVGVISQAFGGGRSSAAIITLLKNLDSMKKIYGETTDAANGFNDAVEAQAKTVSAQLKVAWSNVQVALISFGAAILPVVVPIIKALAQAIEFVFEQFSRLPGPVKTVLVVMMLLLAVAGPIIAFIGAMTLGIIGLDVAFTALDFSVLLIPLAILAVIALFVLAYEKIGWFHNAVDAVVHGVVAGVHWMANAIGNVIGWIKDHWRLIAVILLGPFGIVIETIADNFDQIKGFVGGALGWIKDHWKLLTIIILGPFGLIIVGISNKADAIKGIFQSIAHFIIGTFDNIKSAMTDIVNFVIDRINNLIDAHNALPFVGDIDHIANIGEPSSGITPGARQAAKGPNVGVYRGPTGGAHAAFGAHVLAPGALMVGELGPEILKVPTGAHVTPLVSPKHYPTNLSDPIASIGALADGKPRVIHVPVYLNGRVIAEAVADEAETANARR